MIETTAPWLVLYTVLAYFIGWGIYSTIKDNAFQSGYWKGRKHGFDMHRRMIDARDAQRDAKQFDPDGYYADNN